MLGKEDNSWAALLELLRQTGTIPRERLVEGLRTNNDVNIPPEIQIHIAEILRNE